MSQRVVLLHGFTGSAETWSDDLLGALRQAGIGPLAVDLPGHGARARSDGTVDLSSALAVVFRAIGPGSASVLGYSMGGRLALHAVARTPGRVRRLVLESASPGLASPAEREARVSADAALARRIVELGIERFVDEWEALPLFATQRELPDAVRAALRAGRLRNDATGLAAALEGLGTGRLPSLWDVLPTIPVPTLILVGERDAKFVEIGSRMRDALPNAELVVVPGAGHAVHLEAPEAWAEAVVDFLA